MKKGVKFKKFFAALLALVLVCLSLSACSEFTVSDLYDEYLGGGSDATLEEGVMAVHFFDVGQGDSEFIQFPNGETMLIDAGESDKATTVISNIKNLGVSEITYIIATHPHSDHIGGLSKVIDEFDVGTVYMPDAESTSYVYENLLTSIENEGCDVVEAKAGVTIISESNLKAYLISPSGSSYSDLNNYSAVLKLTYGDVTYLFMGDAEDVIENEITADVSADVIKVGHHGSQYSSTYDFVNRVRPQYAVIEVGQGNSYGHPTEEAISNWQSVGAEILRTDLSSNIIISTDGSEISVETGVDYSSLGGIDIYGGDDAAAYEGNEGEEAETEPADSETEPETEPETEAAKETEAKTSSEEESEEYTWVLNTNSKKIHKPSCSYASGISEGNYETSNKTLEELESEGYTPCKVCIDTGE